MRKILKDTFAIVLFSFLFFHLGCYLSHKEQVVLVSDIEDIFSDAISVDLERRLKDSGIPCFFGTMNMDSPSKENSITVIDEEGMTYVEKDSLYIGKELSERIKINLQRALLEEGFPMQISVLNSIFVDKLQQKGYFITAEVCYINNQTMEVEEYNLGKIRSKSLSTQKHLLIESGEISVQGFYNLPFSIIFHKAPLPFILLFIFWLIAISGFLFLTFRKKSGKEPTLVAATNICKPIDSDLVIQISENDGIYFDKAKSFLYYGTEIIELSPQPAIFFLSLLEASEYFLTYEEINYLFWPKQDVTRNVRSQAVKRLRKDLRPAKLLRVDNINRNGYKLVVLPKMNYDS